jgi:hypothetical protein
MGARAAAGWLSAASAVGARAALGFEPGGGSAPRLASLERAVALPAHVGALLVAARAHCAAEWGEAARPSDRRLAQSARLLRVSAATHGRAHVGALD